MQLGEPSTTAQDASRRRVLHFAITLKAWIPHRRFRIVKFAPLPAPWPLPDPLTVTVFGKGDNHRYYKGSYRAISIAEFDWDGRIVTNITARHGALKSTLIVELDPLGADPYTKELHRSASNEGKCWRTSRKSFVLTLRSKTPWRLGFLEKYKVPILEDLAGLPPIDSWVQVTVTDQLLLLTGETNRFPSHGLRVRQAGEPSQIWIPFNVHTRPATS